MKEPRMDDKKYYRYTGNSEHGEGFSFDKERYEKDFQLYKDWCDSLRRTKK